MVARHSTMSTDVKSTPTNTHTWTKKRAQEKKIKKNGGSDLKEKSQESHRPE